MHLLFYSVFRSECIVQVCTALCHGCLLGCGQTSTKQPLKFLPEDPSNFHSCWCLVTEHKSPLFGVVLTHAQWTVVKGGRGVVLLHLLVQRHSFQQVRSSVPVHVEKSLMFYWTDPFNTNEDRSTYFAVIFILQQDALSDWLSEYCTTSMSSICVSTLCISDRSLIQELPVA